MRTNNLKLFERYFNKQMDAREEAAFKQKLNEDKSLKEEFEEYQDIYEAIEDVETLELRKTLKEIGENYKEKKGKGGRERFLDSWIWIAALLIISLSVVSLTYLLVNSSLSSQVIEWKLGGRNLQNHKYRLEPAYAEMIRYRVRSENFKLERPKDSLIIEKGNNIVFRWKTTINEHIVLDIMNRYGTIVFSSRGALNSPFTFTRVIPVGIYIYRFRTASDTLYTGLLYVI